MKIGDVKIGQEYAALDNPQQRRGRFEDRTLPRQVKVLEIVTEKERRRRGDWMSKAVEVNVRKVKIEVLDGNSVDRHYTSWRYQIETAKQGATLVVAARHLIGPWEDVRGDVAERVAEREAKQAMRESLERRLAALLGKRNLDGTRSSVSVDSYYRENRKRKVLAPSITLRDKDVAKVLALAEKGKEGGFN
jgi:hypothetical protein